MLPFGHQGERAVDLGLIVIEEVVNQVRSESDQVRTEHQRDEDAADGQRGVRPGHGAASENISAGLHVNEIPDAGRPIDSYRFTQLM